MKKRNKQFQGSKSAARRKDYLERQHLTKLERERLAKINNPNATIEEMAEAMGVRLS
jgi:hypothetical protein